MHTDSPAGMMKHERMKHEKPIFMFHVIVFPRESVVPKPWILASFSLKSSDSDARTPLDYRVELDIYNGPLDLLLYLLKRDELDIYDIPISRITDSYMEYMSNLRKLK